MHPKCTWLYFSFLFFFVFANYDISFICHTAEPDLKAVSPTVVAQLAEGGVYQSSFGKSDVQVKTRNSGNLNYWNWMEAF